MNTQDYISSGVLDLYVTGLLSVEEMRDVEMKACQHVEVKKELLSLQTALEHFAFRYAISPRPEAKERIMQAILKKSETAHEASATTSPADQQTPVPETIVRKISPSLPVTAKLLMAACLALLAVMSGTTYYFYHQFSHASEQVALLEVQQAGILKQVDALQHIADKTAENVQMLTDVNTVRVTMKGTEKSPASMAFVYWNTASKAVYLDIKTLPPAAANRQYQLWFIDPQTGPVSAGVFDVKTGEIIQMINANTAAAFAVTLEPLGGSINPTLDQLYIIGNVES
ncbi:MAG: anti-sigma factor [Chitinophagales bacterium]|nr:anti-sigma factor [Chitinophagales bacterium]